MMDGSAFPPPDAGPTGGRARRGRFGATAAILAALVGLAVPPPAAAAADVTAWLLFDAKTGEVLARDNAFQAVQPASITKLMTTYVVLAAIRDGRLRPTSPVTISARALAAPPSKMGFPVGTVLTVDNALKIIMVKSANDVAAAIGESVAGSTEAFVAAMNATAARLGMASTRFINANGLPADGQMTNAHDLALLARALIVEFPGRADLFAIGALQFGKNRIPNHNDLLERFPGSDGMKTGFVCASGYNVVASATREGRRLVAVILGAHSARIRAEKAAELFTRAFEGQNLRGWFARPETIYAMEVGPEAAHPVANLRPVVCGRGAPAGEEAEGAETAAAFPADSRTTWLAPRQPPGPPVKIWLGGAEIPRAAAPTVAAAAPGKARAPGSAFPAGADSPINRSFGLFGEAQAAGAPAGTGATQAVILSPIIEDLPDPPAKPGKAKTKAKAKTVKPAPVKAAPIKAAQVAPKAKKKSTE